VQGNLAVEVPNKTSAIRIVFQHPDPEVVQPVLSSVIDSYLKKHREIHQAGGTTDDFLTQQTDQLRSRLAQTEEELRKARNTAGVISLEDTKKALTEQISKIRQAIFDAEAELAERQAGLKELSKLAPTQSTATNNASAETNSGPVDEYKSLSARLDLLWKKRDDLLTQFTEENSLVKGVREQIAAADQRKKQLETEHPSLASLGKLLPRSTDERVTPPVDLSMEAARATALVSKIKVLNLQFGQITNDANRVDEMEATILDLQRKKELEESNYRYFSASLEQSRIDESLEAGRVTNIGIIQEPSPPAKAPAKSSKIVAMLAAGGVAAGLAWAFLIELYLDRSVKRPFEVETRLRLPLFISIPDTHRNGYRRNGSAAKHEPLLLTEAEADAPEAAGKGTSEDNGNHKMTTWSHNDTLRPFYEALRDRLIMYFEVRNLTHKPKLLAVTAAAKGSGVTTTAAGLAACLSETGDGNVLLVDMNQEHGTAHQFYKGKPQQGLEEALYMNDTAMVQDKLYVVTEGSNGDKLRRVLPRRFTHLVPKLKASDYDYIIFDMPTISQTSVTPHLAGLMDMVLLVIESEKTDRDIVRQAIALLAESKANVCAVLNKTRTYVPSRLHQESLSDT
jgi:uncharacterized protein involved in exopolysaccharide biosynthesis/Mrp family chromosome partitioning ATPase